MTSRKIPAALLAAALLALPLALPAQAQNSDQSQSQGPDTTQPQSQNGVTFMSGGVGDEGRAQLRQAEGSYNLRLMFAVQGSGDFLSDVKVKLMDQHGATLVDTQSDGPFFLAQLKPGTYRVLADNAGHAQTKTVSVPAKGSASASFYWPSAY